MKGVTIVLVLLMKFVLLHNSVFDRVTLVW